jgi:hypothetical protein
MLFTASGAVVATLVFGKYTAGNKLLPQPVSDSQANWLLASSRALEALPEHPFDSPPPRWLRPEVLATVLIALTTFTLFTFFW